MSQPTKPADVSDLLEHESHRQLWNNLIDYLVDQAAKLNADGGVTDTDYGALLSLYIKK